MNLKKWIMLFIFAGGLLMISGCRKMEESDIVKFKKEYESINGSKIEGKKAREVKINSKSSITYTSVHEINSKMKKKESFVLYLGFPECPWCRSVVSTLLEVEKDLGLDTIYYLNIKEIRDHYEVVDNQLKKTKEGTEDYQTLLSLLDGVLENYTLTNSLGEVLDTGEKRIYAPSIVAIVDGKAVNLTDGISDKQTDAYMELSDEIKKDSYQKIKCTIECVANTQKICKPKKC